MFRYRLCTATSIHHLILFIILAIALSVLWLPMPAFNIAECYIMIMTVRVLRCCLHLIMAEWNGSIYQRRLNQEFSVHVCEQRAQKDWSAQMLKASCGVSISPSCTHLLLIAAWSSTDFWSEHRFFLAQEQYLHSISACDHFFSPSFVGYKLHNTVFLQQHSRQASQQAGWSQSLARSHLTADLQAVCDRELRCLFRMRSA